MSNNNLLQICLYCWNHIKGQLNGLCPACRTPYSDDPHKISPVDRDECVAVWCACERCLLNDGVLGALTDVASFHAQLQNRILKKRKEKKRRERQERKEREREREKEREKAERRERERERDLQVLEAKRAELSSKGGRAN